MTDLKVEWNNRFGSGDICVVGADLLSDDGLETAILISLFSDARVRDDELPAGHTWKRGFWGDDAGGRDRIARWLETLDPAPVEGHGRRCWSRRACVHAARRSAG